MLNVSLQLRGEVFVPSVHPAFALLPTLQPFKETAAVQRAVNVVLLRQTYCSCCINKAAQHDCDIRNVYLYI